MKRKWKASRLLLPVGALMVAAAVIIAVLLVHVVGGIRDRALEGIGESYDDPAWIASPGSSYTYGSKQTSIASGGEETHSYAYGAFSGAKTLWSAQERCAVEITHEAQCGGGRFKLVLVTPKREVIDISEQPSPCVYEVVRGTDLKAVGDAAQDVHFKLTIKNSTGGWKK